MELFKRIARAVRDFVFPDKTPLEKWVEEIEREAYDRGELDL